MSIPVLEVCVKTCYFIHNFILTAGYMNLKTNGIVINLP